MSRRQSLLAGEAGGRGVPGTLLKEVRPGIYAVGKTPLITLPITVLR